MTVEKLGDVLKIIMENTNVEGFTIAEYLPFDEHRLRRMFEGIELFTR